MMSTKLTPAEYDKLSEEEKKTYDQAQQEKQDKEQAALPYKWKQTLGDVDIVVPVLKGTRGRDVVVEFGKGSLVCCVK